MFTKRVIPCLDVNGGRVVKGVNFVNLRDAGDPWRLRQLTIRQVRDELASGHYRYPDARKYWWSIWCAAWRRECSFRLRSEAA